jgi:hypothetical protein
MPRHLALLLALLALLAGCDTVTRKDAAEVCFVVEPGLPMVLFVTATGSSDNAPLSVSCAVVQTGEFPELQVETTTIRKRDRSPFSGPSDLRFAASSCEGPDWPDGPSAFTSIAYADVMLTLDPTEHAGEAFCLAADQVRVVTPDEIAFRGM